MKYTPLDKLVSDHARMRAMLRVGGCEKCLTKKYPKVREDGTYLPAFKTLDCSHLWGRDDKCVRYDEDNICGLCGACHMWLDDHPIEHRAFAQRLLGEERYDLLEYRATRFTQKPDVKLLTLYYQQENAELKKELIARGLYD